MVRKFWTHDIHFSWLLFANSCIPVGFELFSFKNEMGKYFSEQDLTSFRVRACFYYNLTVCSFPSYLVLASLQKLPEGMAIITVLFSWCEVPERKCIEIKTYRLLCTMLQLLTGEELILVTVCDFLNSPELKTVVWFIVRWYSNFRKKARRRIPCRNPFLLLFLWFYLHLEQTLVTAARNNFV